MSDRKLINAGGPDQSGAKGRFKDDCPECGEYECVCRDDQDEDVEERDRQLRADRLRLRPALEPSLMAIRFNPKTGQFEAAYPEYEKAAPTTASNESIVSGTPLAVIRKALNQLTDHGSQKCLNCLEYRRAAMEATEDIQASFVELEDVLWRIAAPPRNDGTYNLSREACEQLARKILQTDRYQDADSPHNKERPRDVGAPGAAT